MNCATRIICSSDQLQNHNLLQTTGNIAATPVTHASYALHSSNDFVPNVARFEGMCTIHNTVPFTSLKTLLLTHYTLVYIHTKICHLGDPVWV
jgi:hypothetical protein